MAFDLSELKKAMEFDVETVKFGVLHFAAITSPQVDDLGNRAAKGAAGDDLVRGLAVFLVNRTGSDGIKVGLSEADAEALEANELEQIAESFITRNAYLQPGFYEAKRRPDKKIDMLERLGGESAPDYLKRIFEAHHKAMLEFHRKITEPASSIAKRMLDQVGGAHSLQNALKQAGLTANLATGLYPELSTDPFARFQTAANSLTRFDEEVKRQAQSLTQFAGIEPTSFERAVESARKASLIIDPVLDDFSKQISESVLPINDALKSIADSIQGLGLGDSFSSSFAVLGTGLTGSDEWRKLYETQFKLPKLSVFDTLARDSKIIAASFGALSPSLDEFRSGIRKISSPWLKISHEIDSLNGLSGMFAIGKGLHSLKPYDDDLTDFLRGMFGDWRDAGVFPEDIEADPIAREELVVSLGFDARLTDFPKATFRSWLDITRIREPDNRYPVTIVDVPEEVVEGFKLVRGVEFEIRTFIMRVLAAHIGPKWMKQRVHPDLRKKWEDKRAEDPRPDDKKQHPIFYADFMDYVQIIIQADNWRDVFKAYFFREENIRESLTRLHPVRNDVVHGRDVSNTTLILARAEAIRLLIAIGVYAEE